MEHSQFRGGGNAAHDEVGLSGAEQIAFAELVQRYHDSGVIEAAEIERTMLSPEEVSQFEPVTEELGSEFETNELPPGVLETLETTWHISADRIEIITAPEREQDPTLEWPEASGDRILEPADVEKRFDYRLTQAGIALDAAYDYIGSEVAAEKWFELKRIRDEVRSLPVETKEAVVPLLEDEVYSFVVHFGVTDADFEAAQNGDV